MRIDLDKLSPFDQALWRAAAEPGWPWSLPEAVTRSFVGGVGQLTVWTVIAETDPAARLLERARGTVVDVTHLGSVVLLLVAEYGRPYVVGVWPTAEEGVYNLIGSVPVTDERWRRVERWVASGAAQVGGCALNDVDIDGIGAALGEHGRVEVSRLAARVLADGSSYSRGWAESRLHERPTYQQAVEEVAGKASIRTLTLHVKDRLSLHLRRNAGATYYGGEFRLFEHVVLGALVASGARRRDLLSGRERHSAAAAETAIAVRLPTGLFSDPNLVAELLESLVEQRGTGIAVLHRNPYLHVAVTDYLDGSNADLFVTNDDQVVIYPGYRASVGSLTRLTEHLAERFSARDIADVPALSPPTVDELFTTG
jgi:hypothetical protein